ncbi:acyl carrier protein [Pseudomaricurvus alcaniphilus]|uniref:acyl carrier protein n=1 Tax=Pseudomaricurvus alcaniphilus TaxID=1166482 RepID=UPI001A9F770C|nr:phosphopantetheine-binding protein [Pseudomaricurvus alcaniphilus]
MNDSDSLALAKSLLDQVLPATDVSQWREKTPLLGALPDFDSMAMVALITMVEDSMGVIVSDSDIRAEDFETLGSVAAWIEQLKS